MRHPTWSPGRWNSWAINSPLSTPEAPSALDGRKPQQRDPPCPSPPLYASHSMPRGTEEMAHLGLKRRALKFTARKRQCMGRTPGGAPPLSCPCSDLTSSLEMLWKELSFQEQETLKAVARPLPLPWALPLLPEQLAHICLIDSYIRISHQNSFEQGLPCEGRNQPGHYLNLNH